MGGLLLEILTQLENLICQEDEATSRLGLYGLSRLFRYLPLFVCSNEEKASRSPRKTSKSRDSDHGDVMGEHFIEDAVCTMMSRCILRNLCLNFGSAGSLMWDSDTPAKSKALQLEYFSPYASISDSGDGAIPAVGDEILTPYGKGKVVAVEEGIEIDKGINTKRVSVRLSGWVATLYTYMSVDQ